MTNNTFYIGSRKVGPDEPPYYIGDIGANHDGDIQRAFKLIEQLKEAGADAAKFQNFQADKIVSKYGFDNLGGENASHQAKWKKSVYEIYQDASINPDWTAKLKEKCDEVGLEYFTSPYDFASVDLVDNYVNVYKIGSGDITWLELIHYIASKRKPVLIATGAAEKNDVDRAMEVLNNQQVDACIMQCNTNYTLDAEKYKYVNLNVLDTFHKNYPNSLLGLSDHTLGYITVVGAIAKGARIIEKHFTDDNNREGPDHKFAMNPTTWRHMVHAGNEVFNALGDGVKRVEANEQESIIVQQRSLRAVKNLEEGHVLTKEDLFPLRPNPKTAFRPYMIDDLVGRKLKRGVQQGEAITKKHLF